VSSYVTFETLVTPILKKLAGQEIDSPLLINAVAAESFYKRPGRTDFQRSICFLDKSGNLMVKPNGKQGSGIMTSVANANCYVVLEQDESNIPKDAQVKVQLF
jgi:molybdopterin molybdotransferase